MWHFSKSGLGRLAEGRKNLGFAVDLGCFRCCLPCGLPRLADSDGHRTKHGGVSRVGVSRVGVGVSRVGVSQPEKS